MLEPHATRRPRRLAEVAPEGGLAELIARLASLGDDILQPHLAGPAFTAAAPSLAELSPFLVFRPQRYTRNQIVRRPLFELMAMGWAPGSATAIHDHDGQHCWLAVCAGELQVEAFQVDEGEAGAPRLTPLGEPQAMPVGWIDYRGGRGPGSVHRVVNPAARGHRAVSLHLYVRPIDCCMRYTAHGEAAYAPVNPCDSIGGRPTT